MEEKDLFAQVKPEPSEPEAMFHPTSGKELTFLVAILICNLFLWNCIYMGGFNLGFALGAVCCLTVTTGYLLWSGCRPDGYSGSLLVLSLVIAAGYGWSCDGFVKFILFGFLMVSANLGLCLLASQNRRDPGVVGTLSDSFRTFFRLGLGDLGYAFRGLGDAFHRSGSLGKKGGAFLLGLAIAVPVLAVMLPLLISADAAFDGLVSLLPEMDLEEVLFTAIFGAGFACVYYTRGVALQHAQKPIPAERKRGPGMNPITVHTVLGIVCLLYAVYLLSQLAYFSGGFAGILPEGYSTAEYARRGFFEMTVLCAVNLALIAFTLRFYSKDTPISTATRILCLGIGLMTLFFVAAASAKMFLYIGTYGLTRLRLLTQIVMLFLALTTLAVLLRLFISKMPYMKLVLLGGLAIGAVTMWLDVDSVVARYNVDAFLTGKLETVDVDYLGYLSDGALLQLERLTEQAPDTKEGKQAKAYLRCRYTSEDLRGWNYFNSATAKFD